MIGFTLVGGDALEQVKRDPWSWRALGELAMIYGPGKLAKLDNAIDNLRDARHLGDTSDAVDDVATTFRIGGPKEFDPESLRGMRVDDVRESIPDDWPVRPSRRGGGEVFDDPQHRGRHVRIMPGYPAGSRPGDLTSGPYAVVSQNGASVKIPLAGNQRLEHHD